MLKSCQFEVKDYRKQIEIGCAVDEHGVSQEVVFDIVAELTPTAMLLNDTYDTPFDYCHLTRCVDEVCSGKRHHILQEPMCLEIMSLIFQHPLVNEVEIFSRKTQRYAGTDHIGFRLRLTRIECQRLWAEVKQLRESMGSQIGMPHAAAH